MRRWIMFRTSQESTRGGRAGRQSTYVAASPHIQEGEPFFPFQCIQKVALDGSGAP